MKVKWIAGIIGFFIAAQTVAMGQQTNTVLSASAPAGSSLKQKQQPPESQTPKQTHAQVQQVPPAVVPALATTQYQLINPKLTKESESTRIIRLGNESSRAWTTIVTHQPNLTVAQDLGTHEPNFCLYSLGHSPWR